MNRSFLSSPRSPFYARARFLRPYRNSLYHSLKSNRWFRLSSQGSSSDHLIPVPTPSLAQIATSALLPALRQAYDSALEPARIKAVLLTNPNNPLGVCYPASVIRECIAFCQQRRLHYVSDEVYALSAHEGEKGETGERFVSERKRDDEECSD